MEIRLKKAWDNGGDSFVEGQLLKMDKSNADYLIEKGIAELYVPQVGDEIKQTEVKSNEASFSKEQIEELVQETVSKSVSDFQQNVDGDSETKKFEKGPFKSIGHFAYEVYKYAGTRRADEALKTWMDMCSKAPDGLGEAVDADGGFLVPTQYRNELWRNSVEDSMIYGRTTQIPMATNSVKIPVVKESTRASSIYGGIVVYRPGEGSSITSSAPKFGQVKLELNKLAALCYTSSELLEDSPQSMEPLLNMMFSEAISFQLDDDILNGTGAGQALGVLNAPALVSQAKETAQAADTITTQNIVKMWSRLLSRSQGNAIWLAHMDTFPQLSTLTLEVGTGGSSAGLLQMSTNGVTGAPIQTMLGRPIFFTEHCQTVGDEGDIILMDPRQYLTGTKNGGSIRTASSIHLKFDEDETAFRFILRYDGQPWMQSALTPKRGSNTLSSFVALAARA